MTRPIPTHVFVVREFGEDLQVFDDRRSAVMYARALATNDWMERTPDDEQRFSDFELGDDLVRVLMDENGEQVTLEACLIQTLPKRTRG